MTDTVHPFEAAGLGTAPFSVSHYSESVFQVPGCAPRAGGTCDYCHTAIWHTYWIRGAAPTDRLFKVGCDCVRKTGDRKLAGAVKAERKAYDGAKVTAAREARAKAERISAKERARASRRAAAAGFKAWIAAEPERREMLIRATHRADRYAATAREFVRRMVAGAELSEKQATFLASLGRNVTATLQAGKAQIIGVVVGEYSIDTFYGLRNMLRVEVEGGQVVQITRPTAAPTAPIEGRRVRFSCTIELGDSADRVYGKRPTKFEVLA